MKLAGGAAILALVGSLTRFSAEWRGLQR